MIVDHIEIQGIHLVERKTMRENESTAFSSVRNLSHLAHVNENILLITVVVLYLFADFAGIEIILYICCNRYVILSSAYFLFSSLFHAQ